MDFDGDIDGRDDVEGADDEEGAVEGGAVEGADENTGNEIS